MDILNFKYTRDPLTLYRNILRATTKKGSISHIYMRIGSNNNQSKHFIIYLLSKGYIQNILPNKKRDKFGYAPIRMLFITPEGIELLKKLDEYFGMLGK